MTAAVTTSRNIELPDGRNLRSALRSDGPADLGVDVWFAPSPEDRGKRLRDMIWDTSRCGVKIVSLRLASVLYEEDPTLRTVPVDLRGHQGVSIPDYVVLMEQVGAMSPVHSMKSGARGSSFVVSDEVRTRVRSESFTGLEWESVSSPFPIE